MSKAAKTTSYRTKETRSTDAQAGRTNADAPSGGGAADRTRIDLIRRTVIHEESLPCDVPLNELDMAWLCRQFSTLFDRAARAVFLQGYDLDDVIVERFLCLRSDGNDYAIELPSLNDAERIEQAFTCDAQARELSGRIAAARINQLAVTVTLERW